MDEISNREEWPWTGSIFDKNVDFAFMGPCLANIFSEYNQKFAKFLNFIYFCKTHYMFQTGFPVHHQEHQTAYTASGICQTVLLPVASNFLTNAWRCICSLMLLMMDGKNRLKHVECLTEINKIQKFCKFFVVLAFAPRTHHKLKYRMSVTADIMEVELYLWFAFGRSWVLISVRISVIEKYSARSRYQTKNCGREPSKGQLN